MDLTKGSIFKLIAKLSIPASIGFFFNTMYNVVDTYYAGLLSTEAIAALSLSFPVFFIILAIGSGIGTGATALISNSLGAKKEKEAKLFACQSITFGAILSVFLSILGFYISPFLFGILGATGDYLDISLSYINVIFIGAVFFMMNHVFNAILNSQGDTKTFRNALIIGFFMNLILDPWFMFGGLGLPAMGISGVAWATVIIQGILMLYMLYKVIKTGILKGVAHRFKPKKQPFIDIAKQGFPAGLNMMTVALGIFVITYFISRFGPQAVAAYGIATRIEQIAMLPLMGLNIATLAIIGQNMGARNFLRMKETLKIAQRAGITLISLGTVIVFLFPQWIMGIFTNDTQVIYIGVPYLRIAAFIFQAYMILYINISALQGMKRPMYALWLGLFRQILAPVAAIYIFTIMLGYGLMGIWWTVFGTTWAAAIFTLIYSRHILRKVEIDLAQ